MTEMTIEIPPPMIIPVDTHVQDAKGRAVWQYKNKSEWDALTEIHAERMQVLENVLEQILIERSLTRSIGVQLDRYGADFKVFREGDNDEDFRLRIRVTINILKSFGEVNSLLFNLERLVFPRTVSLNQVFPLLILMFVSVTDFGEISDEALAMVDKTMQLIKAAGVGLEIGLQLVGNAFIVSDNPSGGAAGEGVATLIDGSDGGAFVKSIV